MKKKTNSVILFFGLAVVWVLFLSNAAGRPGAWANAPGDVGFCSICHTSAGAGNISLTGVPAVITPGATYTMTLTLNDVSAVVGGFQIVATNGATNTQVGVFNPAMGQTLNDIDRLVQSFPQAFSGGSTSWPISWTAPSTGAPANVQFFFAGNAANGNGNNGPGDMSYADASAMIPVPVELVSFEVMAKDDQTELIWSVASEVGSSHYEIERSADSREFEMIGKEEAIAEHLQSQSYRFNDPDPIRGVDNYYRIKAVDWNGEFSYSSIKSVSLSKKSNLQFSVYPNPVTEDGILNIALRGADRNKKLNLRIFSTLSQEVFRQTLNGEAQTLQITTGDFSPGIYLVQLSDQNGIHSTQRIVIE